MLKPRSSKIIESLSDADFQFLNTAPPSQRWKKDGGRPFKRMRTDSLPEPAILHATTVDHHHHLQHMDGSPGGHGGVIVMPPDAGHTLLGSVISASVVNP